MADSKELREVVAGRIHEAGTFEDYNKVQALMSITHAAILVEIACSLKEITVILEKTNIELSRIEKRV